MLTPRKIPVLQILNGKLVKTVKFKNPQYLGDPLNAVRIFNEKEVDELIIIDISPERFINGPDFKLIEKLLSECQMPVGFGGGIKTVADADKIFHAGAEKILVNTLAFENPHEVLKISELYGSQAVSFSIDFKYNILNKLCFYKNGGYQKIRMSPDKIVTLVNFISCGEVVLHDINRDGKFCGFNYDFLNYIQEKISVPIVLLGGARNVIDCKEAITAGAHSVAASSMFVYQGSLKAVLIQY